MPEPASLVNELLEVEARLTRGSARPDGALRLAKKAVDVEPTSAAARAALAIRS